MLADNHMHAHAYTHMHTNTHTHTLTHTPLHTKWISSLPYTTCGSINMYTAVFPLAASRCVKPIHDANKTTSNHWLGCLSTLPKVLWQGVSLLPHLRTICKHMHSSFIHSHMKDRKLHWIKWDQEHSLPYHILSSAWVGCKPVLEDGRSVLTNLLPRVMKRAEVFLIHPAGRGRMGTVGAQPFEPMAELDQLGHAAHTPTLENKLPKHIALVKAHTHTHTHTLTHVRINTNIHTTARLYVHTDTQNANTQTIYKEKEGVNT